MMLSKVCSFLKKDKVFSVKDSRSGEKIRLFLPQSFEEYQRREKELKEKITYLFDQRMDEHSRLVAEADEIDEKREQTAARTELNRRRSASLREQANKLCHTLTMKEETLRDELANLGRDIQRLELRRLLNEGELIYSSPLQKSSPDELTSKQRKLVSYKSKIYLIFFVKEQAYAASPAWATTSVGQMTDEELEIIDKTYATQASVSR